MNPQVFIAGSMPEALGKVRQTLGQDAAIVHTRSYRPRRFLWFKGAEVVEITAVAAPKRKKARRAAAVAKKPAPARPAPKAQPAQAQPAQAHRAQALLRRVYDQPAAAPAAQRGQAPRPEERTDRVELASRPRAVTQPMNLPQDHLAGQVQNIQDLVRRVMAEQKQQGGAAAGASPEKLRSELPGRLFDQYLALIQQEVAQELAQKMVEQVRDALPSEQWLSAQAVKRELRDRLADSIPFDERAQRWAPGVDGRPRTLVMVGPTGVGKTTTIAKLAANLKLHQNKRVALVTQDTYRVGAVEQLRTYASVLGVPLHVATSPEEMTEAMAACRGFDAVLIDTAGRSPREAEGLEELGRFIDAAEPHEVHLLLPAGASGASLKQTARQYRPLGVDRLILTKLDEAATFGVLLDVVEQVGAKLSFVTTGQGVPEHLEPGRPQRLAGLMLGDVL